MIYKTRDQGVLRLRACFWAVGIVAICTVCVAKPVPLTTPTTRAMAVPTFHCISLYWSPEQGDPKKTVSIQFREHGQQAWQDGLPMRYNPVDTLECKANYRGSLVNLNPGTSYEITLQLNGTKIRTRLKAAT